MEARSSEIEEEEEDNRRRSSGSCNGEPVMEDRLLGSRLLSQLESSEEDAIATKLPACASMADPVSSIDVKVDPEDGNRECETQKMGMDEIVRELRKLRRQNKITHCLLSGLIIITAAWQFSEVSLLLYMRNKLNPFKAVQSIISGFFSRGGNLQDSRKSVKIEASPLPPIDVPELPHMELPTFTLNLNED